MRDQKHTLRDEEPKHINKIIDVKEPVLFVCSNGGHTSEALKIALSLPGTERFFWITERGNHKLQKVVPTSNLKYVQRVPYKSLFHSVLAGFSSIPLILKLRPRTVISTGAGLALFILPITLLFGAETYFVESLSRINSLSLTGKLLSYFPKINVLSATYQSQNSRITKYQSDFLNYRVVQKFPTKSKKNLKILVLTGTNNEFNFQRLHNYIVSISQPGDLVTWQGPPPVSATMPFRYVSEIDVIPELQNYDLTISHAGVGIFFDFLDSKKVPILFPRDSKFGEHVDNHQVDFAHYLLKKSLCFVVDINKTTRSDLIGWSECSVEDNWKF